MGQHIGPAEKAVCPRPYTSEAESSPDTFPRAQVKLCAGVGFQAQSAFRAKALEDE